MIIEVDGKQISIMDHEDRTVLHMNGGGYERDSVLAWAQMVKPGRVAIDIGAYTGLFSIVAAAKGARVVAVEPMPANRWRLGCNAAMNKAKIEIVAEALSDGIGIAELHYNPKVPLTTGASLEAGSPLHSQSLKVVTTTLDALAYSNVAAIKIDVERHEPNVLRGAMQTIERDKPALLIETLDGHMRDDIKRLLPQYEVAAILDKRNTLFLPQ